MAWICAMFDPVSLDHDQNNRTKEALLYNSSLNETIDYSRSHHTQNRDRKLEFHATWWNYHWGYYEYCNLIIIPSLCLFGILGNLLNLFVLARRMREGVDNMEKGALVGMIRYNFMFITLLTFYMTGSFCPSLAEHFIDFLSFFLYMSDMR